MERRKTEEGWESKKNRVRIEEKEQKQDGRGRKTEEGWERKKNRGRMEEEEKQSQDGRGREERREKG